MVFILLAGDAFSKNRAPEDANSIATLLEIEGSDCQLKKYPHSIRVVVIRLPRLIYVQNLIHLKTNRRVETRVETEETEKKIQFPAL